MLSIEDSLNMDIIASNETTLVSEIINITNEEIFLLHQGKKNVPVFIHIPSSCLFEITKQIFWRYFYNKWISNENMFSFLILMFKFKGKMRVLLRNLFWMGKECLSHTESEIEYALTER